MVKSLNETAKTLERANGKPTSVVEATERMEQNGFVLKDIVPHNYRNIVAWDRLTNTYYMYNVATNRFLNNSNFEGISLSNDVWLYSKTYDVELG